MLASPLSKLNISCPCTECSAFLCLLPKSPPPVQLSSQLRPSTLGLGISLPSTPAANPVQIRTGTPHTTPHLRPTASTLAPSPAFLLTRSNSQKITRQRGASLALPSFSDLTRQTSSLTSERVALASRSLWVHISSPIDEYSTPLSAKTPGLSVCAQVQCTSKVVPGFGRTVCGVCEAELRGAASGLGCVMADDLSPNMDQKKEGRAKLSRADSGIVLETAVAGEQAKRTEEVVDAELELFAVPSIPPSIKLLITHSRAQLLMAPPRQNFEGASTLFALPNTSLDKSFEEFTPTTPTTKYAQDFPTLPLNSTLQGNESGSVKTSKRSSRDVEGLARSLSENGWKRKGQAGSKITKK